MADSRIKLIWNRRSQRYVELLDRLDLHDGQNRTLVIMTCVFVELILNDLVKASCRNPKRFSGELRLFILFELNVVTDHHFRLFGWLAKLRNQAAHELDWELTPEHLADIDEPKWRLVENFNDLCSAIMGEALLISPPHFEESDSFNQLAHHVPLVSDSPTYKHRRIAAASYQGDWHPIEPPYDMESFKD